MRNLLFTACFLITNFALAQMPQWVHLPDTNNGQHWPSEFRVDNAGNSYLIGSYTDSVDLDPGPGFDWHTPYNYSGCYLQKVDVNGNLLWSKSWSSVNGTDAQHLYIQSNQYVYITGWFHDSLDVDLGPGFNWVDGSGIAGYIFKLDLNGNMLDYKILSATEGVVISDMAFDSQGNIVIVGDFSGWMDTDFTAGVNNLYVNLYADAYTAKYDSSFNLLWSHSYGGSLADRAENVAIDLNDDIYVGGFYQSTNTDFDPGTGVSNLPHIENSDIYIQKVNKNGNFVWAKSIAGNDFQDPSDLISHNGNIYMSGYFNDEIIFDYPNNTTPEMSFAYKDGFVAKLDSNGNFDWTKQLGGESYDDVFSLQINNNVLSVCGRGSDSLNFGTAGSPVYIDTLSYGYLAKYDLSGSFLSSYEISGTYNSIKFSGNYNGNDVIYGDFTGQMDLDFGPGTNTHSAFYISDFFLTGLTNSSVGVGENYNSALNVYPNPMQVGERFTISGDYDNLEIYTINGKLVYSGSVIPSLQQQGMYIVRVKSGHAISTLKLVVD